MSVSELLVLSLGLSVVTSALVWLAGSMVERASSDPRLRDRLWGAGLLLGALPPLAVAVLLLAPAPVQEIAAPAIVLAPVVVASTVHAVAVPAPAALPDLAVLASLFLVAAVGMGLLRLISLAVRIGRLMRLMHHAAPADADLARRVEAVGRSLDIQPPKTVVSAKVTEALLSGLGRPCLVLPRAPDGVASDAVIAHELAHLKRGDHRTLWLEEALVVLLAINPLIPVLRARRDAAREEACDALALASAEPAARRAYAQTLINALRDRAGPTGASDDLVVLTFTGAGRTTAMHRLKAVMTPAAPAGRRTRLLAAALGLAVTVAAGGATVALAGQRAVEVRIAPEPASLAGPGPEAVDAATEQAGAEAARQAAEAARVSLPEDARRRFARPSAADYQRFCGSADAVDEAFCAGVLFASLSGDPKAGLCLPETPADDRAAVTAYLARAKAEIALLEPRRDEGAYEYSERALRRAYACEAAAVTRQGAEWLTVRVRQPERTPLILTSGDRLRLTLSSQDEGEGARRLSTMEIGLSPDQPVEREAAFTLRDDQLPSLTQGRTYELAAEIVGAEGRAAYVAEPVTVRLAPGSRGRIANMRPEMVLTRVSAP